VALFGQKLAAARQYSAQVSATHAFQSAVAAYNADRTTHGLPALAVRVPSFTSSGFAVAPAALGQLELDAIRGWNGWAGRDAFGLPLHEFRLAVTANGLLDVTVDPNGTSGSGRWERVPVASRPASGDPDYVQHVLARQPC
jgi:hypothetical protein